LTNFKILWNPWRFEYVKTTVKPREKCVLCELPKHDDKESLIIYRGKHSYIALNAYPYNSGHVMIIPYRHVPSIEDLSSEELTEITDLIVKSIKAIRKAFNPDGFNVGMNIGRAAGAGIDDHVHVHVVPRWVGDANFMAIISSTKNLPISLDETYRLLRDAWKKLFNSEEALDH